MPKPQTKAGEASYEWLQVSENLAVPDRHSTELTRVEQHSLVEMAHKPETRPNLIAARELLFLADKKAFIYGREHHYSQPRLGQFAEETMLILLQALNFTTRTYFSSAWFKKSCM